MPKNAFPAGKLNNDARRKMADRWLATVQWSLLSMRGGRAVAAQDDVSRVTLRVFAKGCPSRCYREVLQILGERASETDFLVEQTVQPGDWYHKSAWWMKDSQSQKTGDSTVTLFRELSDGPVTETNVVDDGCGSRTEIRYVWDAAVVEPLSGITHYGDQGFSVKVGGMTRDPDTGLYSYYVAVTERKTKYISADGVTPAGAGLLSGEDAFSTSYDASWLGLRGAPGAYEDSSGAGVSIWDPAVQALGETLSVQVSRNLEDCSYDARGSRRAAKPNVVSAEGCGKTIFAEQDSENTSGAPVKLGHTPEPVGGVSWQYQSKLRADRLWDVSKDKTVERPVAEAQSSRDLSIYKAVDSVTDRSQSVEPAPASAANGVIRRVSKDKTPGGLKNVRVVTETELPVANARVSKSADVFGSTLSKTHRHQAAMPADPVAGGGVTRENSGELSEGGLVNVAESSRTENFVPAAAVSEQRTLFRRSKRTTDKASPAARAPAAASGGLGVATSESTTPGGRKDLVVDEDEELFVGGATVGDQVSIFERIHSYTDANSRDAAPAASAAGGFIRNATASTNPLGSKNIQVNERTELPVSNAAVGESGDLFHDALEATHRHQADPGPGGQGNTAPGVLKSRSRSKTPGGLVDVSDRTQTFKPVAEAAKSVSGSLESVRESVSARNQPAVPAVATGYTAPGAPIRSLQWQKTAAGLIDHEIGTDTPGPYREYTITSQIVIGPSVFNEHVVNFINASDAQVSAIVARYSGYHAVPGYGWNRFGLMSGQIRFTPWNLRFADDAELIDETGLTETTQHLVEIDGVTYCRVFTITFDFKRDWGVHGGTVAYSDTPLPMAGSSFRFLGNDKFEYKKVTNISVSQTAVTLSGTETKLPPNSTP